MKKVKRTERGWAGHFIASRSCAFRRNTLLEYEDKKIVVSTVGAYNFRDKFETIGYNRYYETMAFYAQQEGSYVDADVSRQVYADVKWSINGAEFKKPYVDNIANQMHEDYVEAVAKMMVKGEV